jgi:regulatory protein
VPPEEDALQQAKRWLVKRGVTLPETHAEAADLGGSASPGCGTTECAPQQRQPAPRLSTALPSKAKRAVNDEDPNARDADPESVARTIVLGKLAASARTRAELERVLKAKNVPQPAAEAALDRMQSVGVIDDQGFARDWVESRQQRRHLSRTVLRRELTAKGVKQDEIESALEAVQPEDEIAAARSLAARKVQSMDGLEQHVQHRRLAAMLGRRGFSSSTISRVLAETLGRDTP